MKVISFVPSWTETLLAAGVDVVGRTHFCVHPKETVKSIPRVGGTKNVNWRKVESLKPDLVVFDREENTKEMAEACPLPYVATHITSIDSVGTELNRLANALANQSLVEMAKQWEEVREASELLRQADEWDDLPAVVDWIRRPQGKIEQVVYLIWKKPWMSVAPQTFIGSVLSKLGYGSWLYQPSDSSLYPQVELEGFDPDKTLLLFSSEPYPFAKEREPLADLGYPSALVNGEAFSWFGLRSLRFLQKELKGPC